VLVLIINVIVPWILSVCVGAMVSHHGFTLHRYYSVSDTCECSVSAT
jgi:hypothetical protein